MTTSVIDHVAAVDRLAERYVARDSYLILAGPGVEDAIAERVDTCPGWTAYSMDPGDIVFVSTDKAALDFRQIVLSVRAPISATVFVIPKTVPAPLISEVVGQDVPADGSLDFIVCSQIGQPIVWPAVVVDMLRRVDPKAAESILAQDLRNAS